MAEVLVNTLNNVYYDIFINGVLTDASGSVTVNVYKNGVKVISTAVVTKISGKTGKYSYLLPLTATVDSEVIPILTEEGSIIIEWNFTVSSNTFAVKEYYDVVTPYCSWSYFNNVGTVTWDDFVQCERIARKVIDGYCGQQFGKIATTIPVEGTGNDGLKLPRRLISLTDITWPTSESRPGVVIGWIPTEWEVAADGWMLRTQPNVVTIDPVCSDAPIFTRNVIYDVEGTWGYEGVPAAVEEASKILIADYLCVDHKYRDKYLSDVKMGDWKFQFTAKAWTGTGNATADELLLDYRNYPGFGVV